MTEARKKPKSPRKLKVSRSTRRTASERSSRRKAAAALATKQGRSAKPTSATKRASKQSQKRAARSDPNQSKSAQMLELLGRSEGATLAELMEATGWQANSVRGFLSATVRNRLELPLRSEMPKHIRRYWIENDDVSA